MKTKYGVKDIRKIMDELDKITGNNTNSIEIKINGRLKRALARYQFYNCTFEPYNFEFSTQICDLDYNALRDTVIHEYAHYVANSTGKDRRNHGHDEKFQRIVKRLGSKNYNPIATPEIMEKIKEYKQTNIEKPHALYCPHCGKVLASYKTKCQKVKDCEKGHYACGDCKTTLIYKDLREEK